jgi:hypothetical protein
MVRTTSLTSPPNLLVNKVIIDFFSSQTNNMSSPNWEKKKEKKYKAETLKININKDLSG